MTDRSRIPPSGPVRLGIAGLWFGKTWARAVAWHRDSRLVAVCVPHQERADEFLAELQREAPDTPPARYFATYEEMLAVPEIDAIGLFTSAPLPAATTVPASTSAPWREFPVACLASTSPGPMARPVLPACAPARRASPPAAAAPAPYSPGGRSG